MPLSSPRLRFGVRLVVLARAWRRELDRRLAGLGLTDATWSPLVHLGEATGALSQKDLAALAGVEASTLVRLVDILATRGLVERRPHPSDRRTNLIVLTKVGRRTLDEIRALLGEAEGDMLGSLGEDEVAGMVAGFDAIDARLREIQARQEAPSQSRRAPAPDRVSG
jgi:MarR family transcriptional regulator, transcriptional regulator for hemolysin